MPHAAPAAARRLLAALLLWLPAAAIQAQTVVLLHGFGSDAGTWARTGILEELATAGWVYAGRLDGREPAGPGAGSGPRRVFTVELDGLAPLGVQLGQLERAMSALRAVEAPIVLVGHSAGGILGRYYLVRHADPRIRAMVTIAAPNLGSDGAELARLAEDTPLGWFSDWMPLPGNPLRLAGELAPERPGSFLFWLNRQPHPALEYVSIIHAGGGMEALGNGWLVSRESQDLRRVRALYGRARSLTLEVGHGLGRADARALLRVLRALGNA